MNEQLKPAKTVLYALFFILLAGAFFFYRERMLFIDAPHTLFRLINNKELSFTVHRYGNFITQLLPLAGVWLHLPLSWLMLLYSVSFNLFFLSSAVLLMRYKRYDLAIMLGLYFTLFASDTFFWTNNEVHEGIVWLLIAFAIKDRYYGKWPLLMVTMVFFALLSLAVWTHPLIMIIAPYLWIFFRLSKAGASMPRRHTVLFAGIVAVIILLKYLQSSHTWYDGDKIDIVKSITLGKIRHIYLAPQFRYFVKRCFTNYWLFLLLFAAGISALLRQKKYLIAAVTLTFAAGYLFLIVVTFWDVKDLKFYMESEYMPLAMIATAPAVYFIFPILKKKQLAGLLAFIFLVRLLYIGEASAKFTERITFLQQLTAKARQKNLTKVIITDHTAGLDNALIMTWGLPVETLMLSAIDKQHPQTTLIMAVDMNAKYSAVQKNEFLGCFERRSVYKLDPAYFAIDTTSPYTRIKYEDLMR